MIVDDASRVAVAVDPADPEAVKVTMHVDVQSMQAQGCIGHVRYMYSPSTEVCSGEELDAEGSSYNSQALVSRPVI